MSDLDAARHDDRVRVYDESAPSTAFIEADVDDLATDPDAGRR